MQEANVTMTASIQPSLSWYGIDWTLVNKRVSNLRKRIYRASVAGNLKLVSNLQKLMLKSYSNRLLAIRRVTQLNQGKNSPGVDKVVVNTNEDRNWLLEELKVVKPNNVSPVRRVYILKSNGKKRPLGLPTIMQRCQQAVVKSALEPYWEAKFEPCSYGFRPGRSAQDAIKRIFHTANPGKSRMWVLETDIKGAFDHISHDFLLKAIGNFPGRAWIKAWLKAGIMEGGQMSPTTAGTPQGGIVSPLLANIAFHGMESALGVTYNSYGFVKSNSPYVLVRYADDSVVFAKTKEACLQAKELLQSWLKIRGLELSEEKTQIHHMKEGFDFLGFRIQHYRAPHTKKGVVLLSKPSKESIKSFKKEMSLAWKSGLHWNTDQLIRELNPKIKGWTQYFRSGTSKKVFGSLDYWMWQRQAWYSKRRHPNKPWYWRKAKYWGKIRGREDKWVFMDKTGEEESHLWKLAWTPIKRHVVVRGNASPDNPALREYWKERQAKCNPHMSKTQSILWNKQGGRCPICSDKIDNGEEVHVHHLLAKQAGGNNHISNLSILHTTCHQQVHNKKGAGVTGVSRLREPYAG